VIVLAMVSRQAAGPENDNLTRHECTRAFAEVSIYKVTVI